MSTTSARTLKALSIWLPACAVLAACGGGGGYGDGSPTPAPPPPPPVSQQGTVRLSLTDAPACGLDHAFVTVEKVRIHASASAEATDAGWTDITLAAPTRIDLLSLTNGTLASLGQANLPAGSYQQIRLMLSANTAANPFANAVVPTGGNAQAVDTPSALQSGLKLNANLAVAANQVADFAIDFDACKSFVRAGNSGKVLLKPVLSLIPMLSDAGQRIVGYVDLSLAQGGATVSAQVAGVPVRATPTDATGKFILYPVPAGTYDLVITANGRSNAVVTGVPVTTTAYTTLGADTVRLSPPVAPVSAALSGTFMLAGSAADTDGSVAVSQGLAGGPSVQVAFAAADSVSGAYSVRLPLAMPVQTPYVAGATSFTWSGSPLNAGKFHIVANAAGSAPKTQEVALSTDTILNFSF